jgi:hypothetical protein
VRALLVVVATLELLVSFEVLRRAGRGAGVPRPLLVALVVVSLVLAAVAMLFAVR